MHVLLTCLPCLAFLLETLSFNYQCLICASMCIVQSAMYVCGFAFVSHCYTHTHSSARVSHIMFYLFEFYFAQFC